MSVLSKWDCEFPGPLTLASAIFEIKSVTEDLDTIGEIMTALARGQDEVRSHWMEFLGHTIQGLTDRATEVMKRVPQ